MITQSEHKQEKYGHIMYKWISHVHNVLYMLSFDNAYVRLGMLMGQVGFGTDLARIRPANFDLVSDSPIPTGFTKFRPLSRFSGSWVQTEYQAY